MQQDWDFLQAAADELEEYILSPTSFWPLENPRRGKLAGSLPRLTLGNLCLARVRLTGIPDWAQRTDIQHVIEKVDAIRSKWRSNWSQKAEHEWGERIHLWNNYLTESLENRYNQPEYASQVRQRVILELLLGEILNQPPEELDRLKNLDEFLRNLTGEGSFVWEDGVKVAFPEEKYWFLYRKGR